MYIGEKAKTVRDMQSIMNVEHRTLNGPPTAYGEDIVIAVHNDNQYDSWRESLDETRASLRDRRTLLADGISQNQDRIRNGNGFFNILENSVEHTFKDKVTIDIKTEENVLPGVPMIQEILTEMHSDIRRVDLVQTLQNDFEDELLKYRSKESPDEVDELKIPQDLFLVAINHEIWKVARQKRWLIAKQHESLYVYNGYCWQKIDDSHVEAFFSLAATKLGFYSPAKALTSNFIKNLFLKGQLVKTKNFLFGFVS